MENNLACTGFGHRDVFENIDKELSLIIEKLISKKSVKVFYVGGNGEFDSKFIGAVRKAKKKYGEIKLILVKPYLTAELNNSKYYYEEYFDGIVIPELKNNGHYKRAITARNRWMIDNSRYVISFVRRGYGGAFEAVKYAKARKKAVIAV